MRFEADQLLVVAGMGIGATLLMDAWNLLLKRAFGMPSLNYCMLGRWLRHMPARFRHESIGAAAAKSHECSTGWVAHYSIGIALALGFVLIVSGGGWRSRGLCPRCCMASRRSASRSSCCSPRLDWALLHRKRLTR